MSKSHQKRIWIAVSLALFVALPIFLLLYFRTIGLIHGPVMFLYTNPLLWKLPLLFGLLVFFGASTPHLLRKIREVRQPVDHEPKTDHMGRRIAPVRTPWLPLLRRKDYYGQSLSWPVWSGIWAAILALFIALVAQVPLNNKALYDASTFTEQTELPEISSARIMPYEVAEQISSSGFDSSTDRLAQTHMVIDSAGRMNWTFGQVPNGFFRYWTKKSQGLAAQPADQTTRELTLTKGEFKYSPNTGLTDSIYWQLYRRHYFSSIPEIVFMLNDAGEPVIVAPFIKYRGFWTKVPYLAGVYVVSTDGQIEELSPEEAAKTPYLARSGQIVPASLARRIQESYKYKNGIWNRFFVHEDQIEISDTEDNTQPYLTAIADSNPQWISTAEPYGKSYATKAILLTDSVTAKTRVWKPAEDASLSGNARALEVVRGLAIPGVLFSRFKAVEPRPIIHRGRLQFLVSVIPDSANTVTKSVIVDAASNKAVATFNHDTDPGADQALSEYIAGEDLSTTAAEITETESGQKVPAGAAKQRELIDQLITNIDQQRQLLEQLRADLRR